LASAEAGYIDGLIRILTARAETLNIRNWFIFGVTVLIIGVCILIFWMSDSIVEHLGQLKSLQAENDAKRKELFAQRKELSEKVGDVDYKLASLEVKEKAILIVKSYLNVAKGFVTDFLATPNFTDVDVLPTYRARAQDIVREETRYRDARSILIEMSNPQTDITVSYNKEPLTLPQELLKTMNQELRKRGVRPDEVARALSATDLQVRAIAARITAPSVNDAELRKELRALDAVVSEPAGGVAAAAEAYTQEKRNQGDTAQVLRLSNYRQQLTWVNDKLTELDKKDTELQRSASESMNSYGAWVPSLAIRVCCVILALFMTQFFMSIYRYNVMILTHYYSRADVLRMACVQGQLDPVNAETYSKLAACMTIEKIDFTLPENVINQLLQAAAMRAKLGPAGGV
jgi:flagellar basal body-associated protein FliL